MACFNYFKRETVVLSCILLIAFGIEFALGSHCTGRYNSCVTKMFVNLLNCSFMLFTLLIDFKVTWTFSNSCLLFR